MQRTLTVLLVASTTLLAPAAAALNVSAEPAPRALQLVLKADDGGVDGYGCSKENGGRAWWECRMQKGGFRASALLPRPPPPLCLLLRRSAVPATAPLALPATCERADSPRLAALQAGATTGGTTTRSSTTRPTAASPARAAKDGRAGGTAAPSRRRRQRRRRTPCWWCWWWAGWRGAL